MIDIQVHADGKTSTGMKGLFSFRVVHFVQFFQNGLVLVLDDECKL